MKYSLIVISFLVGTLSTSAQIERKTESIKPDSSTSSTVKEKNKQTQQDRLKDLDLTKEQKAKVKEIRQEGKAAKEAIEKDDELSDTEKQKKMRMLQREQAQKIQGILTEEQKAKFRASKENSP